MSAFLCGLMLAWSVDYAKESKWKWFAASVLICIYNAIAWYGSAK